MYKYIHEIWWFVWWYDMLSTEYDVWCFLMIYDLWWYITIDDIWWHMIIHDNMIIYDSIWLYMILYDDIWWYMMIYDDIYDIIWWYMMIFLIFDMIWYHYIPLAGEDQEMFWWTSLGPHLGSSGVVFGFVGPFRSHTCGPFRKILSLQVDIQNPLLMEV
jgi:hypothetical protein